jgi:plastocyanin
MRARNTTLISALTTVAGVICCGAKTNTQTIEVSEVNGKLTTSSSAVDIKNRNTTETVRWAGPRDLDFKVNFLYQNPCDPNSSHLDKNPAVCRVLPGHSGAYVFQVVSRKRGVAPTPIILVRVGSCDVCDIIRHRFVGIGCDDERASAAPPNATVSVGEELSWFVVGNKNEQWTVHFREKSPCAGEQFNNAHPVCSVNASPGEYPYRLTLHGCLKPGEGKISVGASPK